MLLNDLPILQLTDVSLAAKGSSRYLLHEISLSVSQSDRIAIIGPSGAGKTTLLRLLNRLSEPTSGSILFKGQRLSQIPVIQLRQQVVLIPQEPKLLGMRVQDTLAYPLVLQQLPQPDIQQRLEMWRTKLHIPQDWLERYEFQLSLGQRQLVAIARGLIMEPKILLLDEPTSALDAGTAHHLVEVLRQLAAHTQTAILMVNHQLELVQQFANRVLYLQQGQLLDNTLATQANWLELREKLIQAEAQKMSEDDEFS